MRTKRRVCLKAGTSGRDGIPRGFFFHIQLVLHNSRDQFTTEAAWSFDGELPAPTHGSEDYSAEPSDFRTSFLWCRNSQGIPLDIWWPLVLRKDEYETAMLYKDDPIEECLPLVAPAIREAAEKLKKYIIPFFEEVARKHGHAAQAEDGRQSNPEEER